MLQFQSFRVYSVLRSMMKPLAISPRLPAQNMSHPFSPACPHSVSVTNWSQALLLQSTEICTCSHSHVLCTPFSQHSETGVSKFQDSQNSQVKDMSQQTKLISILKAVSAYSLLTTVYAWSLCTQMSHYKPLYAWSLYT